MSFRVDEGGFPILYARYLTHSTIFPRGNNYNYRSSLVLRHYDEGCVTAPYAIHDDYVVKLIRITKFQ